MLSLQPNLVVTLPVSFTVPQWLCQLCLLNRISQLLQASDSDSTSDRVRVSSSSNREHESSCSSTGRLCQLPPPLKIKEVSSKGNFKGALSSHWRSGTGKFRSTWHLSSHITASTKKSRYAYCKLCNSHFTDSHGGLCCVINIILKDQEHIIARERV